MCGHTIYLTLDGQLVCGNGSCPDRLAAHKLLHEPERDHVATVEDGRFNLKHPLRERINDDLLSCSIHARLSKLRALPSTSGAYRITEHGDQLRVEEIV